jgi:asparagine synthase (glutamine-hydrolysing)
MAMANSMEMRCPFADHRIQELGLSIPFAWKYQGRRTKSILREALEGILPASILTGKKMGFNPPVPQWMNHELRPMLSEFLSERSVTSRGIFRPDAVKLLEREHLEGKRDNGLKLWALLMLELWFRMYIDQPSDLSTEPPVSVGAKRLNSGVVETVQ